ncbi:plastocyanin/azurin family copper-binding protein [Paenibacillus aurantiacus]|uniref:Plastocyanin/azurin family copper-binding protein n=1 Tax=Paenibacillus aurantiacus TaxID=1936118 RepID=A0ABV5KU29_9BACL
MKERGKRLLGIGIILLLIVFAISACGSNEQHAPQQAASANNSQHIDGSHTEGAMLDDNTNTASTDGDAGEQDAPVSPNDAGSGSGTTADTGSGTAGSATDSTDSTASPSKTDVQANTSKGSDPKSDAKTDDTSDNKTDDTPALADSTGKGTASSSSGAKASGTHSEDKGASNQDHTTGAGHEHANNAKSDNAAVPTTPPKAKPGSAPPKPSDSRKDSAKDAAKNHIVEIVEFAFSPAVLDVKKGDTVTFINRDAVKHSATADDESFDTKLLGQDEELTVTFDKEGEFSYYCLPHPAMTGTITVKSG